MLSSVGHSHRYHQYGSNVTHGGPFHATPSLIGPMGEPCGSSG